MEKYYITGDLEKTLRGGIKDNENDKVLEIDTKVRLSVSNIINKSFDSKIVEYINYDSIHNYFEELNKGDEFIITLEDGIYLDNFDFNYSSSRTYLNKESILCKESLLNNQPNYKILQRNGESLMEQNSLLLSKIIESNKNEVVICDDGIFSGDTLREMVKNIIILGIKVSEIRVILNFSGKNELDGIPIKSMQEVDSCIDWLDERDLFYGTKNGGASFINSNTINGISYCSCSEIAMKKASIPENSSIDFCKNMIDLNKDIYGGLKNNKQNIIMLSDLPRISYLQEKYDDISIDEVLGLELINI